MSKYLGKRSDFLVFPWKGLPNNTDCLAHTRFESMLFPSWTPLLSLQVKVKSHQDRPYLPDLSIVKCVPAKWAAARIARLEPPKQTGTMERIFARPTLLARQLPIRTDNTITNGTLRLPLHRSRHISPPSHQSIDEGIPLSRTARGEIDNALRVDEPEVPFLFCNTNAVDGGYFCAG